MKNLNETLAGLYELDERRTQGEWFGSSSYKAHEFDVLSRTDPVITICVDASKPNRNFIAAAPTMMQVIRHQQEVIERLKVALSGVKQASGEAMDFGDNSDVVQKCYILSTETLAALGAGKE